MHAGTVIVFTILTNTTTKANLGTGTYDTYLLHKIVAPKTRNLG
jgi:hypothetical protein